MVRVFEGDLPHGTRIGIPFLAEFLTDAKRHVGILCSMDEDSSHERGMSRGAGVFVDFWDRGGRASEEVDNRIAAEVQVVGGLQDCHWSEGNDSYEFGCSIASRSAR